MSKTPSTNDPLVFDAWREQLRQAGRNPFLLNLMLHQWQRVLDRLGYFYERLATLPRRNRRALQRALATSLVGAALLLALSSAPIVQAASITVAGACTLEGAITNANDDAATVPDCAAGSGADTIYLTENVTLAAALPSITSEITLEGNGFYVSGDNAYQVFSVSNSGDFTINNTTIQDGYAGTGGGIYNAGTLELNNSTVSGNLAGDYGGGIYNKGTATIDHSTVTYNEGEEGGGIWNSGTLEANYLYLVENEAEAGGGLLNYEGESILTDSVLTGNLAAFGTAILNAYGTVTLNRTTVYENGYDCGCYIYGGTIINTPEATLHVYSSTIRDNYGGYVGGAIVTGGEVIVRDSVISGNQAYLGGGIMTAGGTVAIYNSTISGNESYVGGGTLNYYGQNYMIGTTLNENMAFAGAGIATGAFPFGLGGPIPPIPPVGKETGSATAMERAAQIDSKFPEIRARRKDNRKSLRAVVNQVTRHKHRAAAAPQADRDCDLDCPDEANTYLANSTLSGNTAYGGAGILNGYDGNSFLYNVTVTGNNADEYGGGIINSPRSTLTLERTIVSGNTATEINEIANADGTVNANQFNLFGHSGETNSAAFGGFTPGTSDFNATSDGDGTSIHVPTPLTSILNTTLANNGGPTFTHALLLASPAVDKAPNEQCVEFPISFVDQRGFPRNVDINGGDPDYLCDIGAYELQTTTAVNVTGTQARLNPKGKIVLKWRTTTESQIAGFNVYRRVGKSAWKQINGNFKQAKQPGDAAGNAYRFTNRDVKEGKTYRYKVQVVYLDGHTEWTDVVKVKAE